jgi:hypothetical protein
MPYVEPAKPSIGERIKSRIYGTTNKHIEGVINFASLVIAVILIGHFESIGFSRDVSYILAGLSALVILAIGHFAIDYSQNPAKKMVRLK